MICLIEIIGNKKDFLALETEWKNLLEKSSVDNIFLTWEWVSTWWNRFGKNDQLYILVARDTEHKELIGIAPLYIKKTRIKKIISYRELSFIGSNDAAPDHLDFIAHQGYEKQIATIFIEHIKSVRSYWDMISFDGISQDALFTTQLLEGEIASHYIVSFAKIPVITLPDRWESMLSLLSKNLRYNIGRYNRKLEKKYPQQVQFTRIENENDVAHIIETLLDFASKVRQSQHEIHALNNDEMLQFHQEVAREFQKKGWLRLYTLTVSEKIIAILYCYSFHNTVFYYQTGYDLAWGKYSPGRQILAHGVKQSIAEGSKEFNFLRGEHAYKEHWSNHVKEDVSLKMSMNLYALLIMKLYRVGKFIKAWLCSLAPKITLCR